MQHHLVGPAATLPLLAGLWPAPGDAAEHAVTARAVQWVPAVLFIEPGAVIVGGGEPHNLATIEAAIADGKLGGATLRPLVARIRRELRQQDGP